MAPAFVFAFLSAVFNGSFGVLAKIPPVRRAGVPPVTFNFWVCEGASLAGLAALVVEPRAFTPWGLLSGLLFTASTANTFAALQYLGLSVASGIWCGVAVLTSFFWGVFVAGDQLARPLLATLALLFLVAGIVGIAAAGELGRRAEPLPGPADGAELQYEALEGAEVGQPQQQGKLGRFALGCAAAFGAGGFGGLILAPMLAAPAAARGLPFLPSMSLGIFVASPLVTALLSGPRRAASIMRSAEVASAPGMTAGVVWQAGNVCSIVAVQDPRVGLAVAYPLMQCGLFVAGAWGILLFRELRGAKWQALYWASGAVLLAGAALLAAAK